MVYTDTAARHKVWIASRISLKILVFIIVYYLQVSRAFRVGGY